MSYHPLRAVAPVFSHFSFMVILSCSTLIHETAWADDTVKKLPAGKAGTDRHLTDHRAHEHAAQAGMAAVSSEKIMVHHHRSGKVEAAWNNLKKIPGGTSIIDSKDTAKRSNATNADIFKFQPGLFAQAVCGGDDLRISVRGSGVQDGLSATRYGINFFFDGLPLTTTAGAVNELQEPLGVQYTEVLRGGNAIDMGSTLLGGAINYVSKTGYDADRYHARVEAGSFGYVKEQLSSGGVYGRADYYLSVTNAYRGGYQQNTKTSSFGVNFNFGYKISDHVDTRLFVRYRQTDEGYPGYLTRSQIAQDPTQAQKGYGNTSTNGYGTHTLEPGSYFVGDKTNIHFNDGSKFTLGFDYQNTPMDHRLQFTRLQYGIQNASGTLDYTRSDTLFGRKSDTHVGVYTTAILSLWEMQSVKDLAHYASYGAHVGQLISHDTFGGSTTTFHISNNYELFHNFWLTTAGALTYAPRQIAVTYPTYSDFHTQSVYFQPRAGFRYVVNPHIQFYGNVTRGEEPQTIWRYLTGPLYTSGLATGQNAGGTNIKPSTSTTFEVGTEGNWRGTDWSLTYYHSAIRNELLSVMTPESQLYNEVLNANASPTTHQGVEFSTHSVLYQWSGGVVSLRQAYTYQDFRFNNDPTFGHNKLPGIPTHFYQGQLHLDMKNGFYIAADAQVSSSVEASYDNTYRAAPYHIYNFQMGYQWPGKHRMIYVDLHNLANKHYATAVIPSYKAAGQEVAAMLPGDGLSVFAGIDIGFN